MIDYTTLQKEFIITVADSSNPLIILMQLNQYCFMVYSRKCVLREMVCFNKVINFF